MRKIIYHTVLSTLTILAVTGCQPQKTWHQMEGVTWNTTYHIIYHSNRDLSDSVRQVMHDIETSLSPFDPNSNLSAINANLTASARFHSSRRIHRIATHSPAQRRPVRSDGSPARQPVGIRLPQHRQRQYPHSLADRQRPAARRHQRMPHLSRPHDHQKASRHRIQLQLDNQRLRMRRHRPHVSAQRLRQLHDRDRRGNRDERTQSPQPRLAHNDRHSCRQRLHHIAWRQCR